MKRIYKSLTIASLMLAGVSFAATASFAEGIFDKLKPKSSEQKVESNDSDNEEVIEDDEPYKPSNVRLTWSEMYEKNASVSSDGESVAFLSKKNTLAVSTTKLPLNPKQDFSVDFVISKPILGTFSVNLYTAKGDEQLSPNLSFGISGKEMVVIWDNGDSFFKKLDKNLKIALYAKIPLYTLGVERKGKHLILTVNGESVYEAIADSALSSDVVVSYTNTSKTPAYLLAVHVNQDEYDENSGESQSYED